MHGNNVLLQVHRTHPYRQKELSGMKTPHINNTGNNVLLQVHRTHPYRQKELSGMKTPHINNTGNIGR